MLVYCIIVKLLFILTYDSYMTVLFKLKCERICKTMCGEQVCMKTEAQLCTFVLLVLAVIVSNLFLGFLFSYNKEFNIM